MNSHETLILKGYAFKNFTEDVIFIYPFETPYIVVFCREGKVLQSESAVYDKNSQFGETIIPKEYLKNLL